MRGVAQSGSALAWGASGRRFKSSRPDHFYTKRGTEGTPFLMIAHSTATPLTPLIKGGGLNGYGKRG